MNTKKSRGVFLITGGALGDVPIIQEAKSLGYHVITSGNRPSDPGHQFADEYVKSDYTDDNQIESICKSRNVEVLVSSCHDLAYIAAAKVAARLGFPGFDTPENAEIIHSKNRLRATLAGLGIKTPNFADCKSLEDGLISIQEMRFPIIVKPVDLTGGNGISICKDKSYFERAFTKAFSMSRMNRVIVEEFLEGKYHGFSTLILQGRISSFFLDDEYYLPNTFRVSATSFPSVINFLDREKLIQDLQEMVISLKLVDGLLHVQFIETLTGPVIIEIMRRTPGDLYPKFVELATSVNYSRSILRPYMGEALSSEDLISEITIANPNDSIVRYMLMAKSRGIIENIEIGKSQLMNSCFFVRGIGDFIDNPQKDTCAILFYVQPNSNPEVNFLYDQVSSESVVRISATASIETRS